MKRIIYIFFLILFPYLTLSSQNTVVDGFVKDLQTGKPLDFVHVIFKGSNFGTSTDRNGYFYLESPPPFDSLQFSIIGYQTQIAVIEVSSHNQLEIHLQSQESELGEVFVVPDDGPVRELLLNIQRNIERNNPENLSSYSYQRYSRWEYQLNNVTDRMKDWRMFRNAQGAFQYTEDSIRFLPVYFSEQLVSNQYQSDPPRQLSVIEADNTIGLGMMEDSEISGVTAGLEKGINIYHPFIRFLGHNFISPFSPNGWFYYQYYLLDSVKTEGGHDFLVRFVPRRKGDNTLRGEFTVEDRFFSIKEVEAELTNTAHLNFIKQLSIYLQFQMIDDSIPFFGHSMLTTTVDYVPLESRREQRVELKARQQKHFSNVVIGLQEEVKLSHKNLTYESQRARNSYNMDEIFWDQTRPNEIREGDQSFISAIDSVNQLGFIKLLDKLAQMTITGYYDIGAFELGPYDYMLNFNEVQGTHLFFGGRTGKIISEDLMVWGGLGYGFRNEKWLGRLGAGYLLPSARRSVLKIEYTDDIIQIGENERILLLYENKQHSSESNLLSHFFKRRTLNELHQRQRLRFEAEKEIRTGFNVAASASLFRMHSPEFYPFLKNDQPIKYYDGAEISTNLRWSREEKYFDHGFRRLYLGTQHPILNLSLALGISNVGGVSEPYSRINASVKHHLFTGQARLNYALEGGVIFGAVPYTLLDIPRANQTYGFQTYNFNMMDVMEFLHDRYIRIYAEYRLNGFLFNRIPLIKNLNIREVISFKGFVGDLDERHSSMLDFPERLIHSNTQPYGEIGFGIENLFRFFRVDGVWRATHSWNSSPLGLRVRMEIRI